MSIEESSNYNMSIDLLVALVVEMLANEEHRDPTDILPEFLDSQVADVLYDESTKLWWDGPAAIVDAYRKERSFSL